VRKTASVSGRAIAWLALIAALASIGPASAFAAFPGNNGKIVFASSFPSHDEANTINPDGSGLHYIGQDFDYPARLEWSADGSRIAVGDFDGIRTFRSDGSGFQQYLTSYSAYGEGADWSPDGRKLVTFLPNEGDIDIVDITVDPASRTPIRTMTAPCSCVHPVWSPLGDRIAFVQPGPGDAEIYTMKTDGTDVVPLTNNTTTDSNPSWSPDGNRLAYDADDGNSATPVEIHTINANGTNDVTIGTGVDPDWSPDGTKLVFAASPPADSCIYTMNADGSGVTQITFPDQFVYGCTLSTPDWQPIRPPGYARPRNSSPNVFRLVPAQKPCSSPNASHGPPLDVASCSPAVQASDYLTVGTPDLNAQGANSTGYVTMKVLTEAPIDLTNGDQSDVTFTGQITDVRRESDLADYTGELRLSFGLRRTDRLNGTNTVFFQPATTADSSFGFSFGCTTTSSASVGSTCSVATSADAAVPGSTPEFQRAVWQLGQVQVYDGGADGDGDTTGDNTLFMTQGLFAP
jgi:Tol biopolymer transport system component